ncbi:MAG: tetratricopeptide repeat protein [Thermoguttaceae bacterium]
MRKTPWTACLWPGLPAIWSQGSWSGLALAVGAAAAFDLLLLVSFGWTELVSQNFRNIAWVIFAGVWIVAVAWSFERRRRQTTSKTATDGFSAATEHYLKGDYCQAEQVLVGLIGQNARDLEARLMLATLLRRSGRSAEAAEQLDTLSSFEGAEKWSVEIEEERLLLAEATPAAATAA